MHAQKYLELLSGKFGVDFTESHTWRSLGATLPLSLKAIAHLPSRVTGRTPPRNRGNSGTRERRLPVEILYEIIEYVSDDVPTLCSCALVCRALVSVTYPRIFHTVLIHTRNYVRFVNLSANNPTLLLYVREVHLECDPIFPTPHRTFNSADPSSKLLKVFALAIAPKLLGVERLSMKHVVFHHPVVEMFAPVFPALRSLSLFDCYFCCKELFDLLVKPHPLVNTLQLGPLRSLDWVPRRATWTPKLTIKTLTVAETFLPPVDSLLPWLINQIDPESFTYTVFRLRQLAQLNDAIEAYPSLRHLHIVLSPWSHSDVVDMLERPEMLALTPHYPPYLSALTVDVKHHCLTFAVHMLAQLDPRLFVRLATVNIIAAFSKEDVESVDPNAWDAMDRKLSVLPSLSLGAVNIVSSRDGQNDGAAVVSQRLPIMNLRGVLSFKYHSAST